MSIKASAKVEEKLGSKHGVSLKEVEECFMNRVGRELYDQREKHGTNPRTRWFIAHTNHCRALKVIYVPREDGVDLKSAYEPNHEEIRIYLKHGGPIC